MANYKLQPKQRRALFAKLDKGIQLQYKRKSIERKPIGRTSNWTRGDTVRQGILSGLIVADWGNTRYIADDIKQYNTDPISFRKNKNRGPYYEANPITQKIIGKNPKIQDVDLYMLATLLLSGLVAKKLSPKTRSLFQSIAIGSKTLAVTNNKKIGIGFKF